MRKAAFFYMILVATVAWAGTALAAQSTAPQIGIADRTPSLRAFVHARLVVQPGVVIEGGTLLVKGGVIRKAGADVAIPDGAAVIDLQGKSVYPGFIDPWSDYGQGGGAKATGDQAGHDGKRAIAAMPRGGAGSWNPMVHPEVRVAAHVRPDAKQAEALRKLGFTDVLSTPDDGVWRGHSALLTLADAESLNAVLLDASVAQHAAFQTTAWNSGDYPGSLMGAIALLRQTLLDSGWQQRRLAWQARQPLASRIEANAALAALQPVLEKTMPVFFATTDELDYARAAKLAKAFDFDLILGGNGHEYRRAALLARIGAPVIVPLKLPDAPKIEDPAKALDVSLAELVHWRMAPFNARILAEHGVPIAFTAHALKKPGKQFFASIRKLIESGLSPDAALAALTTGPARMLGVAERLGTLEPGKLAHFLIADRNLLRDEHARIFEVWINGQRHEVRDLDTPNPRGTWQLAWRGADGPEVIEVSGDKQLSAKAGDQTFPLRQHGQRLLMFFPGELLGSERERVTVVAELGKASLDAHVAGTAIRLHGQLTNASAREPLEPWKQAPLPEIAAVGWPAGAHARHGLPPQPEAVLVRNARLWTEGPAGILEHADLLVENGRIEAVGQNLDAPADALVIDASGKQVTPGIIDPHSHIAVSRGVNEGTHAVTSEVRIGDALDPTNIIIYRQLAGGVTSAQVLHGSANPIGGQSQIIKLRWGADAEGLKFRRAPATIKFALGENVKQSNWGDEFTSRYPQTRMGVQQLIIDSFLAARDYGQALAAGHADDGGPLRRDLRLQALWEVLEGQRLVQIHSYRQDEILAFARTAERFGIVPTFQHVLEGYKVAPELAALGAGASTFSDWWAYKFEVYDAIPWNGAMMASQGVTVSFNSDDYELARRLNTEAAKAIKYGDLAPAKALAFVTINPARQLDIDAYVGSLQPGKDADFVIWSGNPLSTGAMALETWVDGRKYFDRERDRRDNQAIRDRRAKLIALALPERVKALAKGDKDSDDKQTGEPDSKPLPELDVLACAMAAERGLYQTSPVNAECAEGESHR